MIPAKAIEGRTEIDSAFVTSACANIAAQIEKTERLQETWTSSRSRAAAEELMAHLTLERQYWRSLSIAAFQREHDSLPDAMLLTEAWSYAGIGEYMRALQSLLEAGPSAMMHPHGIDLVYNLAHSVAAKGLRVRVGAVAASFLGGASETSWHAVAIATPFGVGVGEGMTSADVSQSVRLMRIRAIQKEGKGVPAGALKALEPPKSTSELETLCGVLSAWGRKTDALHLACAVSDAVPCFATLTIAAQCHQKGRDARTTRKLVRELVQMEPRAACVLERLLTALPHKESSRLVSDAWDGGCRTYWVFALRMSGLISRGCFLAARRTSVEFRQFRATAHLVLGVVVKIMEREAAWKAKVNRT